MMAVTILFNAMKAASRFRLWRIDAAREKLEARIAKLTGPGLTREQMRELSPDRVLASPEARTTAQGILDQLAELRARCQRQTGSFITPMGDEMFYRYQESLIEDATTTLAGLLHQRQANVVQRLPDTLARSRARSEIKVVNVVVIPRLVRSGHPNSCRLRVYLSNLFLEWIRAFFGYGRKRATAMGLIVAAGGPSGCRDIEASYPSDTGDQNSQAERRDNRGG